MYKYNGFNNFHENNDICNIKENCNFEGVKPATLNKPYPEIKVMAQNKYYADILSQDFAGMTSELTAITQYINHEIRISPVFCKASRTLLSIAQAEMGHLQRIGLLIMLLGGESCCELKFDTCCNGKNTPWTPYYVDYQIYIRDMIIADIDGEHKAIEQYRKHIKEIDDPCIKANLERIIEDEMYHIRLLTELLHELDNDRDNLHYQHHNHMNNNHNNWQPQHNHIDNNHNDWHHHNYTHTPKNISSDNLDLDNDNFDDDLNHINNDLNTFNNKVNETYNTIDSIDNNFHDSWKRLGHWNFKY